MFTPEEIINKLQPLNLTYLSKNTGIKYNVLWKFANNKLKIIPYDLIKRLSDYFNVA
jgi:hypothetical protein